MLFPNKHLNASPSQSTEASTLSATLKTAANCHASEAETAGAEGGRESQTAILPNAVEDVGSDKAVADMEHVESISRQSDTDDTQNKEEDQSVVIFDQASFAWNSDGSSLALKDISFTAEKGE